MAHFVAPSGYNFSGSGPKQLIAKGDISVAEDTVLAHWYNRFDEFSFSTQEFYDRLSEELNRRNMPDAKLSRVNYPEGGMLSAHRDYYRVARGKHTFVLCAAPFGIDFFVSWWLLETPGCLAGCIAIVMPWLSLFARKTTFYEEDTAIIFRDAVHQGVINTIEGIFKTQQKTLPEFERKPVSRTRLL